MNCKDKVGRTALMYVSLQGNKTTVQLLLAQTDQIDVLTADDTGHTALMLCCIGGHDDIAGLLLSFVKENYGYEILLDNLDAVNKDGETAITLSLKQGHVDCANVLSEYLKYCLDEQERNNTLGAILGKRAKNLMNINKKSRRTNKNVKNLSVKMPISRTKQLTNELETMQSFSSPDIFETANNECPTLIQQELYKTRSCHNLLENLSAGLANISINVGVGVHFSSPFGQIAQDDTVLGLRRRMWSMSSKKPPPTLKSVHFNMKESSNVSERIRAKKIICIDNDDVNVSFSSPELMEKNHTVSNKFRRLFYRRGVHSTQRNFLPTKNNYEFFDNDNSSSSTEESDFTDGNDYMTPNKPRQNKIEDVRTLNGDRAPLKLPPLCVRPKQKF